MTLNKWNYKTHNYDPFEVPDNRDIRILASELKGIINCANCGRRVKFGDTYTSLVIHNSMGFGYCVCEECYEKEWKERLKYKEEQ